MKFITCKDLLTEDNRFILIFIDINTDECLYGLAGMLLHAKGSHETYTVGSQYSCQERRKHLWPSTKNSFSSLLDVHEKRRQHTQYCLHTRYCLWYAKIVRRRNHIPGPQTCSLCVRNFEIRRVQRRFQGFKSAFKISDGILGLHKNFKILLDFRKKINCLR